MRLFLLAACSALTLYWATPHRLHFSRFVACTDSQPARACLAAHSPQVLREWKHAASPTAYKVALACMAQLHRLPLPDADTLLGVQRCLHLGELVDSGRTLPWLVAGAVFQILLCVQVVAAAWWARLEQQESRRALERLLKRIDTETSATKTSATETSATGKRKRVSPRRASECFSRGSVPGTADVPKQDPVAPACPPDRSLGQAPNIKGRKPKKHRRIFLPRRGWLSVRHIDVLAL